jgi:hypothetical protein
LSEQYGTPPPDDPDRIQIHAEAAKGPTAQQILDNYIKALGGADQVAKLTSLVGKGTYVGYDTDEQQVPTEIFVKAPAQRAVVVHTQLGDDTTIYDGRDAWMASIHEPLPLLQLSGGSLDGARMDAELVFAGGLKQRFTDWRAGFPETTINDHPVQVIQTTSGATVVKLFFDKSSGLLLRQSRIENTMVGLIPTDVDYSDYRTVGGVKIPFKWVTTWTDGQSTTQLTDVQVNVPVDSAKFAKPAPAQVHQAAEK